MLDWNRLGSNIVVGIGSKEPQEFDTVELKNSQQRFGVRVFDFGQTIFVCRSSRVDHDVFLVGIALGHCKLSWVENECCSSEILWAVVAVLQIVRRKVTKARANKRERRNLHRELLMGVSKMRTTTAIKRS